MSPTDIRLLKTTLGSDSDARELAHRLVEEGLAACVNRGAGLTSVYRWEGSLREETEIPLTAKTTDQRLPDLVEYLQENHPYDCPEIIVLQPEQVHSDYAQWVRDQVQ